MSHILVHPLAASLLVVGAALGYALATAGMKAASDGFMTVGILLGLIGFSLAFLAEIVLLRRADLSVIYIIIVAAETLLVLAYASWIGEGLNLRQAFGATMVLGGLVAISL